MGDKTISRQRLVEHLTPPAGASVPPYPAARDLAYRASLWALSGSLLALAAAMVIPSRALAEAAAAGATLANLAASWTFLVWMPSWRWAVRSLAWAGLMGWAFSLPILLWGGILTASAVMAAKEHHCFRFWPGRWIPWMSLATGVAWLVHLSAAVIVLFGVLGMLWAVLLWQRSKLPLFTVDG